jgi:hypothetical protein
LVWVNRTGWSAAYAASNTSAAAACTRLQQQQQQQQVPKGTGGVRPLFCGWHGIRCSSSSSNGALMPTAAACATPGSSGWGVRRIELVNNNLSGNLSSAAFMQPLRLLHDCGLTSLVLGGSYGELRGELVPAWGQLDRLETLSIFTTNLTGPLPAALGNMTGGCGEGVTAGGSSGDGAALVWWN